MLKKYNSTFKNNINTRLTITEHTVAQKNATGNDCGVFVISFIEKILKTQNLCDLQELQGVLTVDSHNM